MIKYKKKGKKKLYFKKQKAYRDIILGEDGDSCQKVIIFSHNHRSCTCPMLLCKIITFMNHSDLKFKLHLKVF